MMRSFSIQLLDKEKGITSFQALSPLKREMKGVKVGHAGTLDRFASGMIVALTGGATKLNPIFSSFDKEYIASIRFGEETDTLDPEGNVIASAALPSQESVRAVLPSFLGRQMQTPPVYSAIHVDGKRAYKEARKGKDVEMPEREIEVSSILLLSQSDDEAVIRVSVSKGTYIRALARDIARACGSCGYLTDLRRIRTGPWQLSDSGKDSIELLSMTGLLSTVVLSERERIAVENGTITRRAVLSDSDSTLPYCFLFFGSELFGIGEKSDGRYRILSRLDR